MLRTFRIPLVVVVTTAALTTTALSVPARAATQVRVGNHGLDRQRHDLRRDLGENLARFLGLPASEGLRFLEHETLDDGRVHTRFQVMHRGIPVWAHQVIVFSSTREILQLRGRLLRDIDRDIRDITPRVGAARALQLARADFMQGGRSADPEEVRNELVIYPDAGGKAHLAHAVSFFVHGTVAQPPTYPHYFIDARSGGILFQYEGLNTEGAYMGALGPGGNEKTGMYFYGGGGPGDFPLLSVYQPDDDDDLCLMQSPNVRTYDCGETNSGGWVHDFECYLNDYQEINEAYAPINDAHYFANRTNRMYKVWLGGLTAWGKTIRARVHYGKGYENAFYVGGSVYFGDGNELFYPLSTAADVVSHEIGHGFTERFSGLVYTGQPGGINEAYSDIAGEAAEFFIHGWNDFLVGDHIGRSGPLRDMEHPALDGVSIGHASQYYPGMDPHHSSGVFNRAFTKIASALGVPSAFQLFARANRLYWHPGSDFIDAACGVVAAARDYEYDESAVQSSFATVGVDTANICPEELCCKICLGGKACGNSCIQADYNCNQPQGCACDP